MRRRGGFVLAVSALAAIVTVLPALAVNIVGMNGNDTLRGTAKADKINGRGGNDRIFGLGGNDTLIGGPGRDYVNGGTGNDRVAVRDGNRDTAVCGTGRDTVIADVLDIVRADCETVLRPETPPAPLPPPPPVPPPPVAADPGSYKGVTSEGNFVYFEVTANRTVAIWRLDAIPEHCTVSGGGRSTLGGGFWELYLTPVPIGSDGGFVIEWEGTSRRDWLEGPASFHVKVVGSLKGSGSSGTVESSSEFDYRDQHWSCASGLITWTANRLP